MNIHDSEASIRLNMQMIADALNELNWDFTLHTGDPTPHIRHCLLYSNQEEFSPEILYILPEGLGESFPRDSYCYLTAENLPGDAPHIRNLQYPLHQIINEILKVFQHYLDFEASLNNVLNQNGTLTDLCIAGSNFFHNPVYIHDDMFTVLGISTRAKGMLEFEYNESTGKLYVPLWLIDDFKFDGAYRNTMETRQATIWGTDQYPHNIRSLFMNLWDNDRYLGRVLINELSSSLQPGQFQMIEYFARFAVMLMQQANAVRATPHAFEETFRKLVAGKFVEHRELHTMLSILGWGESDRYLCLQLQNQRDDVSIRSDSALIGKIGAIASSFSSFFLGQRLCIVINLTQSMVDTGSVRRDLAPYVRDSCMYGGISNPAAGIAGICAGFRQAGITLNYILNEDNRQWLLPFSSCALHYILSSAVKELSPIALCEPGLLKLKKFDTDNDTRYYDTLKEYLLHERNIPQTAEALIIHRTTLTYRLSKIQELVKLNLDDPETRTYIIFSIYLLDNQDHMERKE